MLRHLSAVLKVAARRADGQVMALSASSRPRRSLLVLLLVAVLALAAALVVPRVLDARHERDVVAVAELIADLELPAPAVTGCADGYERGGRCWTSVLEGRPAIEGVAALLEHAGVEGVGERCLERSKTLAVEMCIVQGSYRHHSIVVFASPVIAPDPPIRADGTALVLSATETRSDSPFSR